jgi:hypothetical protein
LSKYNKTILTEAGLELASKAAKGMAKFIISKAAASSEKMTDKSFEDLQKLSELPGIVQYGKIIDVADSTQNKGVVIGVGLYFDNQDLTTGYDLNTIGVYAKEEGSDKDILYAITTAIEPESLPDFQSEVLFKFNITMFVVIGRTDKVTVNVAEDGVVTDDKLDRIIKTLPSTQDLANLSDKFDFNITKLKQEIITKLKSLDPLNSPDGNNIYNTTINLDTYSTVGITKFLECKLQSSGQMSGFDQATGKLYGWIFNVPKWNGATEFQQIVYICDFGQGTLKYVRSRVNNEGINKEDFEKILTDKDLQQAIDNFGQTKTVGGIKPDANGNIPLSVNGAKPNSDGEIRLPSLDNPDCTITSAPFDLDTVANNGIYRFDSANLTTSKRASALASLPTTAISGAKGYLIQIQYTGYYTMQLLILYDVPNNTDITLAFRCVGLDSSGYRDTFKRVLSDVDYTTLYNMIDTKINGLTYSAPDYATGVSYSKAHPNVLVFAPK